MLSCKRKAAAALVTALVMLLGLIPGGVLPALSESSATYTSNVLLTFSDSAITAQGTAGGYEIDGTTLTITSSGVFGITGSCSEGNIVVGKSVTGVVLLLQDLTLSAASTAPVVCKSCSGVTLFAMGTVNLTNNETDETLDSYEGAAIKVKSGASLTVEGSGTLNITNAVKNGIKGGSCATVTVNMNSSGSALYVDAANNGIASDGTVVINAGNIHVTAGNEGIKSEPEDTDTDSAGTIRITGGTIEIDAGSDGIQAANGMTISGGTFTVTSDSDCIHSKGDMTISGGYFDLTAVGANSTSSKGIKASVSDDETEDSTITLTITGGSFTIDTADDAVHCDGYIVITAGVFDITTGDDGVHADTSLTLGSSGGKDRDPCIVINSSYEGLESGSLYFYSGKYNVNASDDGINAAGGSSSGSDAGGGDHFNPGGGPGGWGGSSSSSGDYSLNIYGGHIRVNCSGDGLDSNGPLTVTDGDVEVWSQSSGDNEPLDCDGTLTVSGGTVLAAGCAGMGQASPGSGSQSYKNFSSSVSSGKVISIMSGSTLIYNVTAPKAVSYVFFSSPSVTSSSTLSSSSGSVDCTAGSSFSHSWSGTTCTVCGATETQSAIANGASTVYKTAEIALGETGEFTAAFDADNAVINVFYTADAAEPDETNVAAAYPRTDGEIDNTGSGSIRFQVVPDDGYTVSLVEVTGTYTDLLGWDDTGIKNVYEITDVSSDLTVTVTMLADTETGYTAVFTDGDEASAGLYTVTAYYTHNYAQEDEATYVSGVTSAAATNEVTGGIDLSGSGQVNFKVEPAEGYTAAVSAEGSFKNLKTPADTGTENVYRLTKVTGDVTVTVTVTEGEDEGYPVTFAHDNASISLYYTQSYAAADETDADTAVSRDSDSGDPDSSGNGQVNFTVVPDDGWMLYGIEVSGTYKNLKDISDDAGIADTYRITKVQSELTVTVTMIPDDTMDLPLYVGQTVTLPGTSSAAVSSVSAQDSTVITVSGTAVTAAGSGETLLTLTLSDGSTLYRTVQVYDGVTVFTLPSAITTVEDEAFSGNESMTFASLGSSVAEVGANAFNASSLLQVAVASGDTVFDADSFGDACPLLLCSQGSSAETFAVEYGFPYAYID